jgi:plastin-1
MEERKDINSSDIQGFRSLFKAYDVKGTGKVEKEALKEVVSSIQGDERNSIEILKQVEKQSDTLDIESFVNIFKGVSLSEGAKKHLISKADKLHTVIKGGEVGYHTYSDDEKTAFCNIINQHLRNDPDLAGFLPINPSDNDIFQKCGNGVLLCKLINAASPGTIFEKAINQKANMNIFQIKENLNLAINAAKSIGCTVVSIFPESIIEQKEYLILGLIWQIIKILMLSSINLKSHPELIKLVQEGEELADLLKLPPESILMRWFNYHLKNSGSARRISNFSNDVKDGECYTLLLHQIDPSQCDLAALQVADHLQRAERVIANSRKLGVDTYVTPQNIVTGNQKLNIIFAAAIFNNNPGLYATEQELYEAAGLIDDDVEGTREERAFRMWINSLNIEGLFINNLYADVNDGLALLKVIDKVEPGTVNWKRVEMKPNHRLKKLANAGLVIECGRNLRFSLVGVGNMDLVDGRKKLILGYVWQLVRYATLKVIGSLTEEALMKWANGRVVTKANNFRDKSLSNGKFLVELFGSIEPRAINPELVKTENEPEHKEHNAKYVISIARKLGGSVFCTWEDIVEVNPKMIMTLIATAYNISEIYRSS